MKLKVDSAFMSLPTWNWTHCRVSNIEQNGSFWQLHFNFVLVLLWPEEDLRIRALSTADGGALQWHKISILVDPKQISLVSKSEKQKKNKKTKKKW